ncbi:MarR family winged helix-turn-helix transcriptional regulator [Sporolactobacillus pectinivorans]|uniref:MarR family winged helix-turn-helix transcriptional regulator n=1 Tax=Sporolactobacillus pectinivorans TaxID=1591408 RepID=UPI000C25B69C|nr:MarR family transcriptional regulator [Sporolactobacillus pectinivorans]
MNSFPSRFHEDAEASIGFLFIRVYNLWHRQIKSQLQTLGLTHPQYVVLASLGYLLQKQKEVTQILVAQNADMDVMTVSTILKNLEKKKWILRTTSSQDTRAKWVNLTDKGHEILTLALPIVEEIDAKFFLTLGKEEKHFHALLKELLRGEEND